MILLYDKNISKNSLNHELNIEQSHHLYNVLRKRKGFELTITDGNGLEWLGKIYSFKNKKIELKKINLKIHKNSKNKIHLVIAPAKNIKRMEWMLEKLTEMGIASITPILCDRSERKSLKTERLKKIMISALKQSKQFFLPELYPMISFESYIQGIKNQFYIAHCMDKSLKNLFEIDFKNKENSILIGPEGDFSTKEIKLSINSGGIPVSIGDNVLRTETAGIIACNIISVKQQLENI
tara:strand:+ start:1239 stop:1952 length:714 start_codon:yes stop_codon:yes gene_type:complete